MKTKVMKLMTVISIFVILIGVFGIFTLTANAANSVKFQTGKHSTSDWSVTWNTETKSATSVSDGITTWGTTGQETYFRVTDPVTISNRETIGVYGTVHLILDEQFKMIREDCQIRITSGAELHIHAATSAANPILDVPMIYLVEDAKGLTVHGGTLKSTGN